MDSISWAELAGLTISKPSRMKKQLGNLGKQQVWSPELRVSWEHHATAKSRDKACRIKLLMRQFLQSVKMPTCFIAIYSMCHLREMRMRLPTRSLSHKVEIEVDFVNLEKVEKK